MNQLSYSCPVIKASLAAVSLLFTLAHPTSAAIIPVRSAAEISAAMFAARPGDILLMQNGRWENQHISFVGNGTELDPIVLRAETVGSVILTGTSTMHISGEWLVVDGLYFNEGYSASGDVFQFRSKSSIPANHCRLTNSMIRNYNPSSQNLNYKWVSLYGQYNRVDHCYFAGKTHSGTTLVVWMDTEPDYHRIDHNWFGPRPPLGENGGETIRIGTSPWSMYDSNCVVEDNLFQECNGEIEIISNKSCENIYRRNTFRACNGTLTLRHGNRCYVYQNFFLGDYLEGSGGVRIIGEDHRVYNNYFENLEGEGYRSALSLVNAVPDSPLNRYFQVKRALVVNNTVVNCAHSLTIGAGADDEKSLPPLDCMIADNAIYSEDPCQTLIEYSDDPNHPVDPNQLIYLGNIMFGAGGLGIDMPESGILWQDPGLISTDSLWRPTAMSPLRDAAQSAFDFIIEDMDGHVRSGLFDVGADEWSDEALTNHPLIPDDVGPDDNRPRRSPNLR
ncbi:polysaccharide lyase 6 family protein [Planctomycetota bacterium]